MGGMLRLLSWTGLGLAGIGLLLLSWGRAFPLAPESMAVRRGAAVEVAQRTFEELGVTLSDATRFHARLDFDVHLEHRLLADLSRRQLEAVRQESVGQQILAWQVITEELGEQSHEAVIGLDGQVHAVRVRYEEAGAGLSDAQARGRARSFLSRRGVDLGAFDSPQVMQEPESRRVKEVRFRLLESSAELDGLSHGLAVIFDGSRLAGWRYWTLDIERPARWWRVQAHRYLQLIRIALVGLLFLALITVWFRYYDSGRMRLRRSLHVAELVVAAGIPWVALSLRDQGVMSTTQKAVWAIGFLTFVVFMGFLAFLTSGIGEALAREKWQHRLAAFEAVFQGDWRNATVARASLHGLTAGAFGAGLAVSLSLLLTWFGGTPLVGPLIDQALAGGEPAIGMVFQEIFLLWVPMLLTFLVVVPFLFDKLGNSLGFIVSWLVCAILVPMPFQVAPVWVSLPWMLVLSSIPLTLFLGSDLLAALLSVLMMRGLVCFFPLMQATDGALRFGVWATLLVVTGPALWSLRWLYSDRSFTYGYDPQSEIPSDVLERVAHRERQRLELETAKEVQRAIMPRVPSRIAGLQVSHAYLPASEIGGDFYDVYSLDEHRLAFVIGDVAGHGISSGLVMSTVRGALRAHFRFEPDVQKVFGSINAMLWELAERRLLTTLVYGIYDARTGGLEMAGSGHVIWCLRADGEVCSWMPAIYPLGVRPEIEVDVLRERLAPGDSLILVSDGLIEAVHAKTHEQYGYDRLEKILGRMKGASAQDLLAGVLTDVSTFSAGKDLDDDCTGLVLQAVSDSDGTSEEAIFLSDR